MRDQRRIDMDLGLIGRAVRWVLGGRPMEFVGHHFTDRVSGNAVNIYRDQYGRMWMAEGPWKRFRVAVKLETHDD